MGILDMLLDNSEHIGTVAAKVGLPEAQTKAALEKLVPMVRDKLGKGKKPEPHEEQASAEQVAKETGLDVEAVRKLMALTLAEAYKDPRFIGMDAADGKIDGKIGTPIKK